MIKLKQRIFGNKSNTTNHTELAYLKSDGNAFVDTLRSFTANSKIEVGLKTNNENGYGYVGYYIGDNVSVRLFTYGGSFYYDFMGYRGLGYNHNSAIKYDFEITNQSLKEKGTIIYSFAPITNINASKIRLFSVFNGKGSICQIYYYKIYENNILVQDLIPVNKQGVFCFYDKVTDVYYYNAGSGSFTNI